MTKPMVKIVNAETGEEVEREMNAAELNQLKADQLTVRTEKDADATQQAVKQSILDRLGITADEAALLLK